MPLIVVANVGANFANEGRRFMVASRYRSAARN